MMDLPFEVITKAHASEELIREWIQKNRKTLAQRTPDEVAHLAVLCGFNLNDVCRTFANFRDAMDGSYIDNRAAFHVWQFDAAKERCDAIRSEQRRAKEAERRTKECLDLMPLWKDLVAYTITGEVA